MTPLYRHLHAAKGEPFAWGKSDCFLFVADWVLKATGLDPAGEWRGLYDDRMSCMRLTNFHRDPVGAMAGRMTGFAETAEPKSGDVGVVEFAPGEFCAAIFLGFNWAGKHPDGLAIGQPVKVLRAWSV